MIAKSPICCIFQDWQAARWLGLAVCALAACTTTPQQASCAADDIDCFMSHLVIRDANGTDIAVTFIDATTIASLSAATHASASAPALISGPASVAFPYGTEIAGVDVVFTERMDFTFSDPNGCQPVMGLTFRKSGRRSGQTGCFPGLSDHRSSGAFTRNVGFSAASPDGASFDVDLVVISSSDCAHIADPLALVTANGATPIGSATLPSGVFANNPVTIPLTVAPPSTTTTGGTCNATWDCGTSTQCAAAMGGKSGTNGPFASLADCNAWRQKYFAGAVCSSGCQ